MDPEDLEQELWVFFLEELIDSEYPEGTIVDLIKKRGIKIARQERIDYMQFRGAFVYSPAVVRTILEDAVWVEVESCPDVEGRIDVSNALSELREHDRNLLGQRFGRPDDEWKGTFTSAEYDRISKSIDRISMILNNGTSRFELAIEEAAEEPAIPAFA